MHQGVLGQGPATPCFGDAAGPCRFPDRPTRVLGQFVAIGEHQDFSARLEVHGDVRAVHQLEGTHATRFEVRIVKPSW